MKYLADFSEKQQISEMREQIYDGLAQISIVEGAQKTVRRRRTRERSAEKAGKSAEKAQKNEKKSQDKNPKSSRKHPKKVAEGVET